MHSFLNDLVCMYSYIFFVWNYLHTHSLFSILSQYMSEFRLKCMHCHFVYEVSHIMFWMMKKLLEIIQAEMHLQTKSKQSQTNQMLSLTFLTDSWSCTAMFQFLAENQCETLSSCAMQMWRIVEEFIDWLCFVKVCDVYLSLRGLPQKVFHVLELLPATMRKR